jgi:hypothetical protein
MVVVAGSVLAIGAAGVVPAGALSCAAHPDGSPEAIASGTERLSTGTDFFDSYDYAVIGTVTDIRTVWAGEADYGATTLSVDVVAVLGEGIARESVEISSPDPGWMAGYAYEVGTGYFIPVQRNGPEGQPNYSFVCDPITEVDVSIATELRHIASDAGIPFSTSSAGPAQTPADGPVDDEESAADAGSSSSWGIPAAAVALAVVVAVILGALAVRARVGSAPASSEARQTEAPGIP